MKKILIPIALTAALTFILLPNSIYAEVTTSNADFKTYLQEIQMSEQEFIDALDYMGYFLEDFDTVDDLKEAVGYKLTAENLPTFLETYSMTEEQAKQLLVENGEMEKDENILDIYTFSNDLAFYIDYAIEQSNKTKLTDEALEQFLEKEGLNKADLIKLLEQNDDALENYEYIEDLKDTLDYYAEMTPITDESLDEFLKELGMTRAQLEKLLARNDDSLENYASIESLSFAIVDYLVPDMEEMGITEEEMLALEKHFETFNLEDPAVEAKFDELANRFMALGEMGFESATELSPAQAIEIADLFRDLLDAFNLKANIFMSMDGKKTPVSFEALLSMKDFEGRLIIELLNLEGQRLLDMELTPEMFGADLFREAAEDLKSTEKVIIAKKVAAPINNKPTATTVKGGELPNTATNQTENVVFGLLLSLLGVAGFRKFKGTKA